MEGGVVDRRPIKLDNYYKVLRQRPDVLEKVSKNVRRYGKCLLYNSVPHVSGYPRLTVTLRNPKKKVWIIASTLVCIAKNKRKFKKEINLYVHRKCLNRMCVNEKHLELRTMSDIRNKIVRLYRLKWGV